MRALYPVLAGLLLLTPVAAHADDAALSQERQAYLEGIWSGVSTDVSADKLCSTTAPPPGATTLSIEFLRSGGVAFADDGSETAARGRISEMSEDAGTISLTFGNEVWRFRPDGPNVMYRVRSSASLGGGVDAMVFKRCQKAADRSAIALDDEALKLLAADLPGDEAYFIDDRLGANGGNHCKLDETQYLFFVLIGPAEFRVSRWNSFALSDKLASKQETKLPELDPVANWKIENVRTEDGKYVFRMREYENPDAVPETINVQVKPNGSIAIPQWRRTYVRCKGFQSRS